MNAVVSSKWARRSSDETSAMATCAVTRGIDGGNVGACSIMERTCVMPRRVSSDSLRAVKRSERYSRGKIGLAARPDPKTEGLLLLTDFGDLEALAADISELCQLGELKESIAVVVVLVRRRR